MDKSNFERGVDFPYAGENFEHGLQPIFCLIKSLHRRGI